MLPSLTMGDIILLKAINSGGFVCGIGCTVFFKEIDANGIYICSLVTDFTKKAFITIKDYQIATVLDGITGIVKYQHDPSDAL
jgi:hypothetical protein